MEITAKATFTKEIAEDESTVNEYLRDISAEQSSKGYKVTMRTSKVAVVKNNRREVFPVQDSNVVTSPAFKSEDEAKDEFGKLFQESLRDGWKSDADPATGLSEVWGST